ncbi:hypothetical protein B0H11DRAFT_2244325 [Mycena galericulata]|nr:hypothetical protein B0H11DRAFT_2262754 [Mycena galericulata]KAJ7455985.1 hypothetical protein B0H11DRAFT_2244325 [Mycena galericulata]
MLRSYSRLLCYMFFPLSVWAFFRSSPAARHQIEVFEKDILNGQAALVKLNTTVSSLSPDSSVLALWRISQASSNCQNIVQNTISHIKASQGLFTEKHGALISNNLGVFNSDIIQILDGMSVKFYLFDELLLGASVWACKETRVTQASGTDFFNVLLAVVPATDPLVLLLEDLKAAFLTAVNIFLATNCPSVSKMSNRAEL